MTAQLEQARMAWQKTIDENPETVIVYRKSLIDDGFGGQVESFSGTETPRTIKIRLSHEGAAGQSSGPGGLSENLNRYIMVNHKTMIIRNEVFEAIGKHWRIETVDPIYRFGGLVGYRAKVIEATTIQENT